jgi:hypothetical protein
MAQSRNDIFKQSPSITSEMGVSPVMADSHRKHILVPRYWIENYQAQWMLSAWAFGLLRFVIDTLKTPTKAIDSTAIHFGTSDCCSTTMQRSHLVTPLIHDSQNLDNLKSSNLSILDTEVVSNKFIHIKTRELFTTNRMTLIDTSWLIQGALLYVNK